MTSTSETLQNPALPKKTEEANPPSQNKGRLLHGTRRIMAAAGLSTVLGIGTALGLNYAINHGGGGNKIEQVDVSKDGVIQKMNLGSESDPFEILSAREATVVGIEKTEEGRILLGVSVTGEKVGKKDTVEYVDGGTAEIPTESYSGVTVWFRLSEDTSVLNDSYFPDILGRGSDQVLQHVKVGDEIKEIGADLTYFEGRGVTQAEIEENNQSLEKMDANVNKMHLNSDKSFIFNTKSIIVASSEQKAP